MAIADQKRNPAQKKFHVEHRALPEQFTDTFHVEQTEISMRGSLRCSTWNKQKLLLEDRQNAVKVRVVIELDDDAPRALFGPLFDAHFRA